MDVYADANTTTAAPPEVLAAARRGENQGHPLRGSRAVEEFASGAMRRLQLEVESAVGAPKGEYLVLHTSCADEANEVVVRACVAAWHRRSRCPAHVVVGAAEPPSVVYVVEQLCLMGVCRRSVAAADPATGVPTAATVGAAICGSTCLVCVSAAAPTGAVADLAAVSRVCWAGANAARRRVPLHSDMSTFYPRTPPLAAGAGPDSFAVSLHHMHAPPGLGLLVVRRALVDGYGLQSAAAGRMPNLPAVLAAVAAHRFTFADRVAKNRRLLQLVAGVERVLVESGARSQGGERPVDVWYRRDRPEPPEAPSEAAAYAPELREIVIYGPDLAQRLPNTLAVSLAGPSGKTGDDVKSALEGRGVRVGAPLPCARQLRACGVRPALQLLVVSLPDGATQDDAAKVAVAIMECAVGM